MKDELEKNITPNETFPVTVHNIVSDILFHFSARFLSRIRWHSRSAILHARIFNLILTVFLTSPFRSEICTRSFIILVSRGTMCECHQHSVWSFGKDEEQF